MRRVVVAVIVYKLKSRVIIWRAARCLRPCDRLSSPPSVILKQLGIKEIRRAIVVVIVYPLKSRVIIWRAASDLKLCDRFFSPSSVIL